MKKRTLLTICSLGFIAVMSSFPRAYSLVEKDVGSTSFGFTGVTPETVTKYYLRGSFTSTPWAIDNNYLMTDNTSSMTAESGKVAEYKIKDLAMTKGQELKAYSDLDDKWYGTFSHKWTNAVSYSSDNYQIPMTSNSYKFYLKLYENGTSNLYIEANKDVMFFKPSDSWKQSSAKFTVEFDNDSKVNLTNTDSDGYYRFNVPSGATQIRFSRYKSDYSERWNYSSFIGLANTDTNNSFALYDDTWNNWGASSGSWSAR